MYFAHLFVPLNPIMKISSIILKILMPLVLGAAILYWMYRGENWQQIYHVMTDEMDWTWMLLSFPFGILAQMFRGWRWRQTLEPILRRNEGTEVRGSENTSSAETYLVPPASREADPRPPVLPKISSPKGTHV